MLKYFITTFIVASALMAGEPSPQTVHGRLSYSNGTPSCRIWIVGTKRILGAAQSDDETPSMPKELHRLMTWEREIFADFVIEPLTPYKKGVMQQVRVVSASKIVVTENDKVILRKDKT
jgi:hypothetical protein